MPKNENYLDLPADETDFSTEDVDNRVRRAQEQLLELSHQKEHIERQKRELEELSRRQELFQQGRVEMVENLTRALVVIDREAGEAERRVELLHSIQDSFANHLTNLETLEPGTRGGEDHNKELNKALSAVDDARAEYQRNRSKISSESDEGAASHDYDMTGEEAVHDFLYWLKAGVAFTLVPMILTIVIIVILHLS